MLLEFAVHVVALDQAFAPVFEAACYGERAARQLVDRATRFDRPLDEVCAIVFNLFSSERRIKYAIWMYVKILVGERIKKDSLTSPGRVPFIASLQPIVY